MTYYLHETPGRLRLRTPILKKNPIKADEATQILMRIQGVKRVIVRPTTGSVTIDFCSKTTCPSFLINTLSKYEFICGIIGFPRLRSPMNVREKSENQVHQKKGEAHIQRMHHDTHHRIRTHQNPDAFQLNPKTKKLLNIAAKIILPILAERAFGKIGKDVVSTLLA